jgi:hypothetical protein
MLKRLRFLGVYLLFWVLLFEAGRVLFLLCEWPRSSRIGAGLLAGSLASGLRMDLSVACYVTAMAVFIGRISPAAVMAGRAYQQAAAQAYIELGRRPVQTVAERPSIQLSRVPKS